MEALLQDISCPPISRLTDEKFTGGHPCLAPRLERGEGGEHLVTLPAEPSKNFHTQYFLFTVLGENRRCKVLDYSSVFMTFFFFWEYIWSGREGIWKTCGGTIWISYRPQPLLFPLTEGLGALQRCPQTNKTSALQPSLPSTACTMGRLSFEFPSKLVSIQPRPIWFEYLIVSLRQYSFCWQIAPHP